jgi:hypothetical protein
MRPIAVAAALVLACAAMNLGFIVGCVEDLWKTVHHSKPPEIIKQRVCVLVVGGNASLSSLAESIEGDHEFSYGVFSVDPLSMSWFHLNFPVDSLMHYVRVEGNESIINALLFAADVKGCAFYFVVDDSVRFHSAGWASALVRALRDFSPSYLGAVSPMGCADCIFIHSIHRRIFTHQCRVPDDACWVEWVRSVYGSSRLAVVSAAAVNGSGSSVCTQRSQVLISSGRLRVGKFLGLTRVNAASLVVDLGAAPYSLPAV